jgi:hypothetical protein
MIVEMVKFLASTAADMVVSSQGMLVAMPLSGPGPYVHAKRVLGRSEREPWRA